MEYIRDRDGKIVSQSQNLRGIRRYVSNNLIKKIDVSLVGIGEGQLSILFDNGNSFQTNFSSFNCLKRFVRNWRNTYGAPLSVNGKDCGKVSFDNEALV